MREAQAALFEVSRKILGDGFDLQRFNKKERFQFAKSNLNILFLKDGPELTYLSRMFIDSLFFKKTEFAFI